jgi:hypothetical protein
VDLYLLTPCIRVANLFRIKKSINFSFIKKWIIIYNTEFVKKKKIFTKHKSIIELFHKDIGSIGGNSQRNFGLEYLKRYKNRNFYIYFLDDDNVLHNNFYKVVENCKKQSSRYIYTFDQFRNQKTLLNNKFRYVKILKGNRIKINHIDTAMFLPNYSLVHKIRWSKEKYNADGEYIVKCINSNKSKHKYLPIVGCYYNFLNTSLIKKMIIYIKFFLKTKFLAVND